MEARCVRWISLGLWVLLVPCLGLFSCTEGRSGSEVLGAKSAPAMRDFPESSAGLFRDQVEGLLLVRSNPKGAVRRGKRTVTQTVSLSGADGSWWHIPNVMVERLRGVSLGGSAPSVTLLGLDPTVTQPDTESRACLMLRASGEGTELARAYRSTKMALAYEALASLGLAGLRARPALSCVDGQQTPVFLLESAYDVSRRHRHICDRAKFACRQRRCVS